MSRYAKLTVVAGVRETGKSNKTLEMIFKAVAGDSAKGIKGRKALIFDSKDEYRSYEFRPQQFITIKDIYYRDIPRFTAQFYPEVVRLRPYDDDGKRLSSDQLQSYLGYVLSIYRDGIFLVEDVTSFVSDSIQNDIIGSLATLRQAGVDLIMHFQLVGKLAHPKILGMCNYIRLHKTHDQVERYRDRFLDKTRIMMVAEIIVDTRYRWGVTNKIFDRTGKFFNVTVDWENFKIYGIFTQAEAKAAIEKYLGSYGQVEVRNALKETDRSGTRINKDYATAYNRIEATIFNDFFDFKDKE